MMLLRAFAWLGLLVCVATTVATTVATPLISQEPPHPVKNAASGVMLSVEGLPADPREIDFKSLPRLRAQHVIVSDVREVREVRALTTRQLKWINSEAVLISTITCRASVISSS